LVEYRFDGNLDYGMWRRQTFLKFCHLLHKAQEAGSFSREYLCQPRRLVPHAQCPPIALT
jgi:hypothetical protein